MFVIELHNRRKCRKNTLLQVQDVVCSLLRSCSHRSSTPRKWLRDLPHRASAGRPGTMANAGRMSQVDTARSCQGAEQKTSRHSSSGHQMFCDFSVCSEKHPVDDRRAEE